jgi:hypothetical protein
VAQRPLGDGGVRKSRRPSSPRALTSTSATSTSLAVVGWRHGACGRGSGSGPVRCDLAARAARRRRCCYVAIWACVICLRSCRRPVEAGTRAQIPVATLRLRFLLRSHMLGTVRSSSVCGFSRVQGPPSGGLSAFKRSGLSGSSHIGSERHGTGQLRERMESCPSPHAASESSPS